MKRFLSLLMTVLLLCSAAAFAQSNADPTVDQVYQAARQGDLAGARSMIDEVVTHHPKSAKAHYVKAEIASAQHDTTLARDELATAERLAPGLPFAKPQSVNELRAQIDGSRAARSPARSVQTSPAPEVRRMGAPGGSGGFPIGLLIAVGVIVFAVIAWRGARRRAEQQRVYAPPAEPFGRYPDPGQGYPGGGYPGASPYGAPGAGYPPQQPSMGSSLARGLGTGLAVGAGVVAAEEIGHRLFDHDRSGGVHPAMGNNDANLNAGSPLSRDAGLGALTGQPDQPPDFGGQDFGVDAGGWDDGGTLDAGDVGGGNDWDT
jgi:uncharacterized protein